MIKLELCRFKGNIKICKILVDTKCDGTANDCKFYKTEKQFQEERNRAILINRAKCNCNRCKYMGIPCRIDSDEEGEEDA